MSSNSNTPFFTVVIPTYNRSGLIMDTLVSVFNQSFESFELLLVDDGSTDDTEFVVSQIKDPRFKYFKKKNQERGAARNFGVVHAKGKYITFCDSDDLLYPDYLKNAHETISSSAQEIPWLHLAYEIKRDHLPSIKMSINPSEYILTLAKGNPLSCMGVFVLRNVILNNLFNEDRNLAGSEDWELWVRLASQYPIVIDKRISASLIMHDGRSVLTGDELKLQLRKFLSIGYAFDEKSVQLVFSKYRKIMEAYFDTYISLHLVLDKQNLKAFKYLFKAVLNYPFCIFERRFLAIIKHWMLNVLKYD